MDTAWRFFSDPGNLGTITPPSMGFRMVYRSGGPEMYAGQLIGYKVTVLPGITVNWLTEITHVRSPYYFVDEQRVGPYSLWHHQHHFREVDEGVEMTDEVNYAIPYAFLGRLANEMFVRHQLMRIFNYRAQTLTKLFEKPIHQHL